MPAVLLLLFWFNKLNRFNITNTRGGQEEWWIERNIYHFLKEKLKIIYVGYKQTIEIRCLVATELSPESEENFVV